MTHPFPITDDVEEMKETVLISGSAIMHNGVLGEGEEHISDTMVFIRDVVFPVLGRPGGWDLISRQAGGSKLALYHNGRVCLTGDWVRMGGVYYSNKDFFKRRNARCHHYLERR